MKRLMDMDLKYRQLVFSLDGVEPLIHLLKTSSDALLRETVVKILIDISTMGSEHKVQIGTCTHAHIYKHSHMTAHLCFL